jgi:hypothetical protein
MVKIQNLTLDNCNKDSATIAVSSEMLDEDIFGASICR